MADLEGVALVTTLEPRRAREATSTGLARLRADWDEVLEEGAPTLRARREVVTRALSSGREVDHGRGAASSTPEGSPPRPGAGPVGAVAPRDDLPPEPVADALWAALVTATPMQRAVLACRSVWDLDLGETAHLLDMPVSEVEEHHRTLQERLAAAHARGRAEGGQGAAPWLLTDDLSALLDLLLDGQPDPPDPAALVSAAGGVRRRTLVLGGTAVVATAAAGWAIARSVAGDDEVPGPTTSAAGPTDAVWTSTQTWPARGSLADDQGVLGLVLSRTSSGSRLIYADDIGDQRIVIAAARKIPGAPDGTLLRVWQGTRGELPDALEEVDLPISQIEGVNDVVAAHLPQVSGSALIVLTRPSVDTARVSRHVRPTRAGALDREWEPLALEDGTGVDVSPLQVSSSMRVRVAGYDGPAGNPSTLWLDSSLASDGADGAAAEAAEYVARATGDPVAAISSTVAVDSVVDGSVLDPLAAPGREGDGRVVVISTRTPGGATLRSVLAADDGRSNAGTVVLEPATLVPADAIDDPVVLRISDAEPGQGRFLVIAPGAARAQLLATLPSPYPMSKETPFTGDTSIITLVDADAAAAFTLVLSDADGKEMYRGVAPVGTWLLDLFPHDAPTRSASPRTAIPRCCAAALSDPGWRRLRRPRRPRPGRGTGRARWA